jgi:hypothetical protein
MFFLIASPLAMKQDGCKIGQKSIVMDGAVVEKG